MMASGDPTWDLSDNDTAALNAVLASHRVMLAVLKAMEWSGLNDGRGVTRVACPCCGVLKERDGKHGNWCGLDAAIAKVEGR